MNESISKYWDRSRQYWEQLNRTQRMMLAATILFVIITIILSIYFFSKTEYSIAYTDLTKHDAATIQQYLENAGIPYKFNSDGSTVGVPTKHVTQVRIDVESQNMLTGGSIGFGIFRDNISSFGMTENQFEVLYTDGRAGEVEQLINALNGVKSSKVLLNLPKDSVFLNAGEPKQATASVVVNFAPGFQVKQELVDTIYNLVSKSTSNLPLENITVTNQEMEMLPSSRMESGMDHSTSAASQQFQIKKQYEVDIQRSIESFLGKIMSPEKVIVHVLATLNFDQINRQQTLYTPVNTLDQTGIERSIQEIQKSYVSEGAGGPGGVAGTGGSDVTLYPSGSAGSGSVNSEETETIINYEINEIRESIVASPFVVEDLTISVGIEPFIADDPESLSQATMNQIHAMIVNIVATSLANSGKVFTAEEIGRKVSVIAQPFYGRSDSFTPDGTASYLYYGLVALAVLLAAAAGYYFAFLRKRAQEEEEEMLLPATPEFPAIDLDSESEDRHVRKQLESLAKKKPDEFVNLLRTWLVDE